MRRAKCSSPTRVSEAGSILAVVGTRLHGHCSTRFRRKYPELITVKVNIKRCAGMSHRHRIARRSYSSRQRVWLRGIFSSSAVKFPSTNNPPPTNSNTSTNKTTSASIPSSPPTRKASPSNRTNATSNHNTSPAARSKSPPPAMPTSPLITGIVSGVLIWLVVVRYLCLVRRRTPQPSSNA